MGSARREPQRAWQQAGVRSTSVLLVVVALIFAGLSGVAAQEVEQGLRAEGPVDVSGAFEADVQGGAIHFRDGATDVVFSATASAASIEYIHRSGTTVGPPWDEDAVQRDDAVERGTHNFENASLSIETGSNPLEILAFQNQTQPTLRAQGTGTISHSANLPDYLARIGDDPSGSGTEATRVGFWYEPLESWLMARGADQATMTGDFSLLINNATVIISEDGRETWRNWTGYRQTTDGELARTYEERILLVHLEDGRLQLQAPDRISLLAGAVDLQTTGVVSSGSVQGEIETTAGRFLFQDQPLRLEGSGSLTLSKQSPASLGLAVDDDASFAVEGGQRLETSGGLVPSMAGSGLLWGGLGLAVLVAGAMLVIQTGALGAAVSEWRDRRYTTWMLRGRELASGRDFEEASTCFRKATRAKPDRGIAWYHLAMARLENREYDASLDIVEELRASGAHFDKLDVLVLEAEASYLAGRIERCRQALGALAEGSQLMAAGLIQDLALDAETLGPELASQFGDDDGRGGGLTGYA